MNSPEPIDLGLTAEPKVVKPRPKRVGFDYTVDTATNTFALTATERRRDAEGKWIEADKEVFSLAQFPKPVWVRLALLGLKSAIVSKAEDTVVSDMRAVVARLAEEGEAFFTNASPIAAGVPRAPTMNLSILITAYLAVYAATTGKTAPDVAEDLKPIVDPSGDKAKTTALRIAHLLADPAVKQVAERILAMKGGAPAAE